MCRGMRLLGLREARETRITPGAEQKALTRRGWAIKGASLAVACTSHHLAMGAASNTNV